MTPHEAYKAEFARRFAERKKKQLNSGPCAAVIVDCDCDYCIDYDVQREMRHWKPEASS